MVRRHQLPLHPQHDAMHHGTRYSVVRGALSPAQVQQLREWSTASAPVQALRHQYNQKCDPHRYEYLMFADHEAGAGLADAVKQALIAPVSAELETSESFCIVSEAGSRDQPWHTDSIPSETLARDKWSSSLHYIGVLTPLADTDDVCGRTEVSISSHTTLGDGSTAAGRTAKLSLKVGDCLGTLLVMRPRLNRPQCAWTAARACSMALLGRSSHPATRSYHFGAR